MQFRMEAVRRGVNTNYSKGSLPTALAQEHWPWAPLKNRGSGVTQW